MPKEALGIRDKKKGAKTTKVHKNIAAKIDRSKGQNGMDGIIAVDGGRWSEQEEKNRTEN